MTAARVSSERQAYLLLAPLLLLFVALFAYPLVEAAVLSVQQTRGPDFSVFVGLSNFIDLFKDPLFLIALRNTLVFTACSLGIQLPLALAIALALDRPWLRGRATIRLLLFSPAFVGVVFVATLFSVMFEPNVGVINGWLEWLTFGAAGRVDWLDQQIMPAMILAAVWMYTGFSTVLFLAALQSVDPELIDAARLDGASTLQRFWNVTVPAIQPVGAFIILFSVTGGVQLFELPWILLNNSGGPENRGLTLVMYLYQTGFERGDLGYASAIGWVVAVVLLGCAVALRPLMRRNT